MMTQNERAVPVLLVIKYWSREKNYFPKSQQRNSLRELNSNFLFGNEAGFSICGVLASPAATRPQQTMDWAAQKMPETDLFQIYQKEKKYKSYKSLSFSPPSLFAIPVSP